MIKSKTWLSINIGFDYLDRKKGQKDDHRLPQQQSGDCAFVKKKVDEKAHCCCKGVLGRLKIANIL